MIPHGMYISNDGYHLRIKRATLHWLDNLTQLDKRFDLFAQLKESAATQRDIKLDTKIRSLWDNLTID